MIIIPDKIDIEYFSFAGISMNVAQEIHNKYVHVI